MNKNSRMIGGVLIALIMIGLANASYKDYNVNLKILPGEAYENTNVMLFGYITISDWGKIIPVSDLKIRVQQSSNVIMELNAQDLHYTNDINKPDKLVDGFFYKKISLPAGSYLVAVFLGDEQVSSYQVLKIKSGESNLTLKSLGFTESDGPSFELNYTGLLTNPNVDVSFYGRKNIDSPETTTYSLTNNVAKQILTNNDFSLSNYVDDEQVYGLVVYATAGTEAAEPYVILRNTGIKTSAYNGTMSVTCESVKKGTNTTIPLSITNTGSLLTNYSIELSGSLSDYATIINSVEVMPSETTNQAIELSIPRKYVQMSGDLTITIKAEGNVVAAKTLNIELTPADPTHSIIVEGVHFSQESYFKGDNVRGYITLKNDGDFTEELNLEYYFENGNVYKNNDIKVEAGKTKNVTFILPTEDNESSFYVSVSNDVLNYANEFEIPIVEKDYSFRFYLTKHELISKNSPNENVELVLENAGNVEDLYILKSDDYQNYVLTNKTVILKPGETARINATISIPVNKDSLNVTFSACSQIGSICSNDEIKISIFNVEEEQTAKPSTVIVEPSKGEDDNEMIYTFEITNNNLISKKYKLNYESDGNVSFSVYPEDYDKEFIIQPGETITAYLYANGKESNITYSVIEDGIALTNETVELTASQELKGLTGFAVAAGSVLGIAGLIVLVLFIYFYFIRQPPEGGDDEFKPVEVKKADLTKPNVKNENSKYW